MVAPMASFPCPYCNRAVDSEADGHRVDACPSCAGDMLIAYRYRLVEARGKISGGALYEATDEIFGETVAVLFVERPDDRKSVERFVEGNRLFAELGGGRGLVKLRELSGMHARRPHVVMGWLAGGTLDAVVRKRGAVDQATLLELIGDLLVGLGKAHRSMPTLIHGHIHPGKIGFTRAGEAVLFGFEWAQQVFEQDSHLADAFVEHDDDAGPSCASDLRQLAVALYYAATGEWIAEQPLADQRARVAQRLGGPLEAFLDRMLGAGVDGYESAVEALADFEQLLAGINRWQPRRRARDRVHEVASSSWSPDVEDIEEVEAVELLADDSADHDDDDDDDDLDEDLADIYASESSPPPRPSVIVPSAHQVAHRQIRASNLPPTPAKPASSPGKILGILIGSMVGFSMCVAAIVEDAGNDEPPPPRVRGLPGVEPIPAPPRMPDASQVPEYEPLPDPMPEPRPVEDISFVSTRHYEGKVTGPDRDDIGEPCDVWVEPIHTGGLNCRFYIDCGEPRRRIYGGGDVGYSDCKVLDGIPIEATDEDQDAPDGAFMALLAGEEPMVLVEDRWLLPPKRVLIDIEVGSPHDGPVPNVPLAPRMSRERIEAAIERGDLPEL